MGIVKILIFYAIKGSSFKKTRMSREARRQEVEEVLRLFYNECSRLQVENQARVDEMKKQVESQAAYIRQLEDQLRQVSNI